MSKWLISFLGSLVFFVLSIGYCPAQDLLRDHSTGKTFPSEVSFQEGEKEYTLHATGVATRKKFFVKIYSVAHYMENPAGVTGGDIYENILNSNQAKQLTSIWVRNVAQKKVVNGYRESFEKVLSSEDLSRLKPEIDTYLSFFTDVNNGDEHTIRWLPDGTITVSINGEMKGTIKNESFAKALWSIWLGRKSVVKREQLVARIQ